MQYSLFDRIKKGILHKRFCTIDAADITTILPFKKSKIYHTLSLEYACMYKMRRNEKKYFHSSVGICD